MSLTIEDKAMIWASGNYLCEYFPEEFTEWDDDRLEQFCEENAWEPLQYWSGADLLTAISLLATDFEMYRKEINALLSAGEIKHEQ